MPEAILDLTNVKHKVNKLKSYLLPFPLFPWLTLTLVLTRLEKNY